MKSEQLITTGICTSNLLKNKMQKETRKSSKAAEDEEYEIDPEEGVPVPKRLLYSEEKFKPKILTGTSCMPGKYLKL